MKILFIGTGEIGVPTLRALVDSRHELLGVVTQPDRPAGRKNVLTPPPIKVVAEQLGLPVLQPVRLRKPEVVAELGAMAPELIVVMAYGQILPRAVLEMPAVACLNLHASILPKYRGAAPIQAAIRAGDEQTGITVMYMDEGLDTGDILWVEPLVIAPEETGGSLHDRLAALAPVALMKALAQLEAGNAERVPQDESLATHVGKLGRGDGRIDWSRPADEIERTVRAFDPWPGTQTTLVQAGGGRAMGVKVLPPTRVEDVAEHGRAPGEVLRADRSGILVATGDVGRALLVTRIQPESRKPMDVAAYLAGRPLEETARFL